VEFEVNCVVIVSMFLFEKDDKERILQLEICASFHNWKWNF